MQRSLAMTGANAPVSLKKGYKMAVGMTLLRTAAIVGANWITHSQGTEVQKAKDSHLAVVLKKNASSIFILLFLRDVIRSLLVVGFIGVGAMAATFSLENDPLFRASCFFSLAVLCVVVILALVALGNVKKLGDDIPT